MKNLWDVWPEATVKKNGTVYIQTPDEKWFTYLSIWRRSFDENLKTTCPCPLPEGHVTFEGKNVHRNRPDQKQMELF